MLHKGRDCSQDIAFNNRVHKRGVGRDCWSENCHDCNDQSPDCTADNQAKLRRAIHRLSKCNHRDSERHHNCSQCLNGGTSDRHHTVISVCTVVVKITNTFVSECRIGASHCVDLWRTGGWSESVSYVTLQARRISLLMRCRRIIRFSYGESRPDHVKPMFWLASPRKRSGRRFGSSQCGTLTITSVTVGVF